MQMFKPEFEVLAHVYLPSVLKNLEADCEFLKQKIGNQNLSYHDFINELPTQNMLRVGFAHVHYKNNASSPFKNGMFVNTDMVMYKAV